MLNLITGPNLAHAFPMRFSSKTKEEAIYIAENQNISPRYDCTLIKEEKSDIEDEETTIKEVK